MKPNVTFFSILFVYMCTIFPLLSGYTKRFRKDGDN